MKKRYIPLLLAFIVGQNLWADTLGEFSKHRLDGWQQKSFKSETDYQLQLLEGMVVLKANSKAAGSGLFKEQHIDLEKTPFLNGASTTA